MAKVPLYPNLLAEMARNGETTKTIGKVLHIDRSQVYRKLYGQAKWTLGDIEVLCDYFKKDFYELFKKGEEK